MAQLTSRLAKSATAPPPPPALPGPGRPGPGWSCLPFPPAGCHRLQTRPACCSATPIGRMAPQAMPQRARLASRLPSGQRNMSAMMVSLMRRRMRPAQRMRMAHGRACSSTACASPPRRGHQAAAPCLMTAQHPMAARHRHPALALRPGPMVMEAEVVPLSEMYRTHPSPMHPPPPLPGQHPAPCRLLRYASIRSLRCRPRMQCRTATPACSSQRVAPRRRRPGARL